MPGLDASRATQVVTRSADGLRFGSGYLVCASLVITAQHVVAGAEEISIRFVAGPRQATEDTGHVVWNDATVDLAVVRVSGHSDVSPVRFGRLAANNLTECDAVGYPGFRLRGDQPGKGDGEALVFRDSHNAHGTCDTRNTRRSGTLSLSVEPPPPHPDPDRSAWEGMSGAAVFAHDSVIGVVTANSGREGTGMLTAQPVARWHELPAELLASLRGLIDFPEVGELPIVPESTQAAFSQQGLPRITKAFTGRSMEYDRLFSTLKTEHGGVLSIHSVDGLAGVGKTTFAVHTAYRLASRFPDGQIFLDLQAHARAETPSAEDMLGQLLLGDGIAPDALPDGLQAREQMWRTRTVSRRMLLILDDAASTDQVRPLIPSARETLVLITSRRRLTGLDDAIPVSLEVLEPRDAERMFVRTAGRPGLSAEDPDVTRLSWLCGYLPLALRITAARLKAQPRRTPADLVGDFEEDGSRLGALGEYERSIATALDLSYRDLTEEEQRLFWMLGAHPGTEYEPDAAAALLDTNPALARHLLAALEAHRLIDETAARRRYRMHDLVREYARQLADRRPDETGAAVTRLLDYYSDTWDMTGSGRDAILPWLRTERANLLACTEYAFAHGRDRAAIQLTRFIAVLANIDGPRSNGVLLSTRAAETARRIGDDAMLAYALLDIGSAAGGTGDYSRAVSAQTEAAELFSAHGNRSGQASALTSLGHVRWMTGDYPGARECFNAALPIFIALDDRIGRARVLRDRGELRRMTGDLNDAMIDQEAALKIYQDLDARSGQAGAHAMLGEINYLLRDYAAATYSLKQALAIAWELDNESMFINFLVYWADLRAAMGDLDGGIADLEYALDTLRRDPDSNEAWTLGHYAALIARSGDIGRALDLYRETVERSRACTQPDDEALALEGIGECLALSGDLEGAVMHLAAALEIFERLGMRLEIGRVARHLDELSDR